MCTSMILKEKKIQRPTGQPMSTANVGFTQDTLTQCTAITTIYLDHMSTHPPVSSSTASVSLLSSVAFPLPDGKWEMGNGKMSSTRDPSNQKLQQPSTGEMCFWHPSFVSWLQALFPFSGCLNVSVFLHGSSGPLFYWHSCIRLIGRHLIRIE